MPFKPFANLARQGIARHLVNGAYAQSVVAATQSSSIPFAKLNSQPTRLQSTFSANAATRTHPAHGSTDPLSAYHGVHSHPEDSLEKDAKRYLFSKKILWSKAQHQTKELHQDAPAEPSVAETPPPLASESEFVKEPSEETQVSSPITAAKAEENSAGTATPERSITPNSSGDEPLVSFTPPPPQQAVQTLNADLQKLMSQARYKDITLLFDHMVKSGLEPTKDTYNYLLTAISQLIQLNVLKPHVSHLLDVYSDLLSRKITPDTKTYSILVSSLIKVSRFQEESLESRNKSERRFSFVPGEGPQLIEPPANEPSGLKIALDIFYASVSVLKHRVFPANLYQLLIDACAQKGLVDDMLKIYVQMESAGVKATRDLHFSLMDGFAKSKDMHSALEVYEECKLSMEQAKSVTFDAKHRLYKQLILAYLAADDPAGALAFLSNMLNESTEKSDYVIEGFIDGFLQKGMYRDAYEWISQLGSPGGALGLYWTVNLLSKASDGGDFDVANRAYGDLGKFTTCEDQQQEYKKQVWNTREEISNSKLAFLAFCIRERRLERSREVWSELLQFNNIYYLALAPTLSYAKLLFESGYHVEALQIMANLVSGIESQYGSSFTCFHQLQGAWSHLVSFLTSRGLLTPEIALDIWRIGGYGPEGTLPADCIRSMLGVCHNRPLLEMTWSQLDLVMQLNSSLLTAADRAQLSQHDIEQFEETVRVGMGAGWPIDGFTQQAISRAVVTHEALIQIGLARDWHDYVLNIQNHFVPPSVGDEESSRLASPTAVEAGSDISSLEQTDPYWHKMDLKLSNTIDMMIDKKKELGEIMKAFQGGRECNRIIRYQTIAKLILLATRLQDKSAVNGIFRAVQTDIPLILDSRSVRAGWCCILDAVIAAALNFGNRKQAKDYQQQMHQIGGSPSANTYGLFIVSLKDSPNTFDEASEAVKIFEEAKAKNVFPTPFLYNALIGKLARARRVDDCLYYFSEMRALGLKPTSVTYGTMINALCRVSDERFAEELFQEMESMPNYKPRAAPYNSLMQYFTTTKRDRSKVMTYYNRMVSLGIEPTGHTYKLLIDAYASLDPPDIDAALSILDLMRSKRHPIETSHYAAVVHAQGCVLHNVQDAVWYFDQVTKQKKLRPDSTLYQALFEALVANHKVNETSKYLQKMREQGVEMTPYIANTLIHGWALEKNIEMAKSIYDMLSPSNSSKEITSRREPSTYEAMTRAYLAVEDRNGAMSVVNELMTRGYPSAVSSRITDLVKGGSMHQTVIC